MLESPTPSIGDVLVRYDASRGWWVDVGLGLTDSHEFYPTSSIATRVAFSQVTSPSARVLLERGVDWVVVALPALLDQWHPADLDGLAA